MKNTIILPEYHEPEGYGAFDEEQLNERDEDIKVCPDCLEPVDDCECKYFSPCCGADMRKGNGDASFEDYGICPECKEHI
jgi:hypothetical protein